MELTSLNAKLRAKQQQPDPLAQEAGLKAQLKTVVDKLVKLVGLLHHDSILPGTSPGHCCDNTPYLPDLMSQCRQQAVTQGCVPLV